MKQSVKRTEQTSRMLSIVVPPRCRTFPSALGNVLINKSMNPKICPNVPKHLLQHSQSCMIGVAIQKRAKNPGLSPNPLGQKGCLSKKWENCSGKKSCRRHTLSHVIGKNVRKNESRKHKYFPQYWLFRS